MSAHLGDDVIRHSVDWFPENVFDAWENVLRYAGEAKARNTYLAALNLQVATAHWRRLANPSLVTIEGERVVRTQESVAWHDGFHSASSD